MRTFFLAAAVLALSVAQAAADDDDVPAKPIHRPPPEYPALCKPIPGEVAAPHTVVVAYDVRGTGQTRNVRIIEATDTCFEEISVATIRGWTYEPRRVNGVRTEQKDLVATFTFVFEEPTQIEEFDARPISRTPPRYPEHCMRTAKDSETVVVEFDVTEDGTTENIRTVKSSNSCLNGPARRSVEKWRYRPKTVEGKAVPRKGVQTAITFNLLGGVQPEYRVRRSVQNELKRARRSIGKDSDPQKALDALSVIDEKYGDTFSRAELANFHFVRAAARIEAGDYRGALDDLYVVKRTGMAGDAAEVVDETIAQLEAAIAAQEAAAAQSEVAAEQPDGQ